MKRAAVGTLSVRRRTQPFELRISLFKVSNHSLEKTVSERAELENEKIQLENRLQNLSESGSFVETDPSRHPALLAKKVVDLNAQLQEKEDARAAAIVRLGRVERTAEDAKKELAKAKQDADQLRQEKVCPSRSKSNLERS